MHNAEKSISGPLDFKMFWGGGGGGMPPDLFYKIRPYLINPVNKYSRQCYAPGGSVTASIFVCKGSSTGTQEGQPDLATKSDLKFLR